MNRRVILTMLVCAALMTSDVFAQPGKKCPACPDATAQLEALQQQLETAIQQMSAMQALIEDLQSKMEPTPDPEPEPEPSEDVVSTTAEFKAALSDCQRRLTTPVRLSPGTYTDTFTAACQGTRVLGVTLPDGQRVTPDDVAAVELSNPGTFDPVLTIKASDVLVRGLTVKAARPDREAIVVGDNVATTAEAQPTNVTLDQIAVLAVPGILDGREQGGKRGIAAHSRAFTLRNSHVAGFWYRFQDSQAFWANNGPGPYTLENNFLEASGENVMFGGDTARIVGVVPSGVIRGNTFYKPPSWRRIVRDGVVVQEGRPNSVKNLLEFKNAQNVLVEDNVFDGNWADSQAGHAIVLTPRTEDGRMPWARVTDIVFRTGVIRNASDGACFNILGRDNAFQSEQTARIRVEGYLFEHCRNGFRVTGGGVVGEFAIVRSTFPAITGSIITFDGTTPRTALRYEQNVARQGAYGFIGAGLMGTRALDAYTTVLGISGNIHEKNPPPYATIAWPAGVTVLEPGALAELLDAEYRYKPGGAGY